MPTGQVPRRASIIAISQANPCEVTTSAAHGYATGDFIRFTDLDYCMPVHRGMDPINDSLFEIVVTGLTTFTLKNHITHLDIDSTNYATYVVGGMCNLDTHTYIYQP
jgi:hypothetical protein